MAFYEHRDYQVGNDGLDERPGDGADVGGLCGVAVERSGDGVRSGAFGGEGVIEGGDVGEDGAVKFGVDAADQFGPGFGNAEAASSTVEGDDVCSCIVDSLGGAEVGSDVDVAVRVVSLDEA